MPQGPVKAPGPRGAASVFFLCLLAACSGQPVQPATGLSGDLPPGHLIDGLPFHPQVEDQCGPASLATMLAARGVRVDPGSLRGKLYIPGKQGAVTTEMVARARRFGLLVYPLAPVLEAILEEVAADNPVLVMQNLGLDWLPRWHFSVVIGFDRAREVAVLRSGDEPEQEVPFDLFLKTWGRADRWAVVILAPQDLPATAREEVFVESASELERVGETSAALAAYLAAAATWPESDTARFGAGNAAYALGHYDRAAELFSEFLVLRPRSPAGWNNLAHSLQQQGCETEAIAAARCAIRLDPEHEGLMQDLVASEGAVEAASGLSCQVPRCPR